MRLLPVWGRFLLRACAYRRPLTLLPLYKMTHKSDSARQNPYMSRNLGLKCNFCPPGDVFCSAHAQKTLNSTSCLQNDPKIRFSTSKSLYVAKFRPKMRFLPVWAVFCSAHAQNTLNSTSGLQVEPQIRFSTSKSVYVAKFRPKMRFLPVWGRFLLRACAEDP